MGCTKRTRHWQAWQKVTHIRHSSIHTKSDFHRVIAELTSMQKAGRSIGPAFVLDSDLRCAVMTQWSGFARACTKSHNKGRQDFCRLLLMPSIHQKTGNQAKLLWMHLADDLRKQHQPELFSNILQLHLSRQRSPRSI